MRKCPICGMRMRIGIRFSDSQQKRKIIFYCENCYIWVYPKYFKKRL